MKYAKGDYYQRALVEQQKGDWRTALDLTVTGADNNCGMCLWLLGYSYKYGYWGIKSSKEARKKFMKGMMLNSPRCVVEIMKYEKIKQMEIISDDELSETMVSFVLNSDDNYAKGVYYEGVEPDEEKCLQYYLAAAKEGDCFAEFEVGHICDDINEALQWHRLAAEKGLAPSQGVLFYGSNDKNEQVYWGRKAAEQDDAEIQYDLGLWFVDENNGKFYNPAAALYWFNRAYEDSKYEEYVSEELMRCDALFKRIENCRTTCMTLVASRLYTGLPKDMVVLLAKYLWKTRDDCLWENAATTTKKTKH